MRKSNSKRPIYVLSIFDSRPQLLNSSAIYLLSGAINSGKTTTLQRWIQQWQADNIKVFGVVAPAIFENNKKVGFDLIDIETKIIYSLIRSVPFANDWQMGRFHFDLNGFERLTDKIIRNSGDFLILDEIGPLELKYQSGLCRLFLHFLTQTSLTMLIVVRESEVELLKNFIDRHQNKY